jgi:UDP-N-acetylmuramoylalanine-D-glutamate ligase
MKTSKSIKDSSFAVYGLGLSGNSVLKFLKKKKVKKIYTWDDKKNKNNKKKFNLFLKILDEVNYIVISPGINVQKTKFKLKLFNNKKKNNHRPGFILYAKNSCYIHSNNWN